MGKRARRDARAARAPEPTEKYGAQSFQSLYEIVCTLDRLLAIRNEVLADLRPHLTERHLLLLGWPPGAVDRAAFEAAKAEGLYRLIVDSTPA